MRTRLPTARMPIGYLAAMWRFFRDPRGSKLGKLFVLATLVYVVMPLDFIPDIAPVIGWLDDLGLASIALGYLVRVAKQYRAASMLPEPQPQQQRPGQPPITMPEYDAYAP